jgi:hypothetical protein
MNALQGHHDAPGNLRKELRTDPIKDKVDISLRSDDNRYAFKNAHFQVIRTFKLCVRLGKRISSILYTHHSVNSNLNHCSYLFS